MVYVRRCITKHGARVLRLYYRVTAGYLLAVNWANMGLGDKFPLASSFLIFIFFAYGSGPIYEQSDAVVAMVNTFHKN